MHQPPNPQTELNEAMVQIQQWENDNVDDDYAERKDCEQQRAKGL